MAAPALAERPFEESGAFARIDSQRHERSIWAKWSALLVVLALLAAYANHFGNEFHFDDFHTVTGNPAIRSLANIPSFFRNAATFSVLPSHCSYRPLVSASLAFDYWMAGGLRPFFFHLSTFLWFLAQLGLMFVLFRKISGADRPALFAVALYGLHPANAETVNYIVQRADVYATLGIVAGLVIYATLPALRGWGLYLAPPLAGMLAKPSALVFAPILLAYILLFDRELRENTISCVRRSGPAFALSGGYWIFQSVMTPAGATAFAAEPLHYWITQPYVTLRYVRSFLLPFYLSADTDLRPFDTFWDARAIAGCLFLLSLVAAAVAAARIPKWRPAAFGLLWFLIALAPTAVMPLAEVENDHRLFLPFVGLALTGSTAILACVGFFPQIPRKLALTAAAALLLSLAWGTHKRNQVWRTEETLWRDVTQKSPRNGRGWMNYGLTQMQKGQTAAAYRYFERASQFAPNYSLLEVNLGIASGALGRDSEAERHFERAIRLAPADSQSYSFYGRWLEAHGRPSGAVTALKRAIELNPADPEPRRTLALAQNPPSKPEDYLARSLTYYQENRFEDCIRAANDALRLRPAYAEAYNNLAAAYQSLGRWDEAIAAAEQALRLEPGLVIARNNLQYERGQKALAPNAQR